MQEKHWFLICSARIFAWINCGIIFQLFDMGVFFLTLNNDYAKFCLCYAFWYKKLVFISLEMGRITIVGHFEFLYLLLVVTILSLTTCCITVFVYYYWQNWNIIVKEKSSSFFPTCRRMPTNSVFFERKSSQRDFWKIRIGRRRNKADLRRQSLVMANKVTNKKTSTTMSISLIGASENFSA